MILNGEDFKLVLKRLLNSKLLIIFVSLAGVFAGLAYTEAQQGDYAYGATASACVTYSTPTEQSTGSSVMMNYSDIITSKLVGEYAAQLMNDPQITSARIQRNISISISKDSYVMHVTATDNLPERAVKLANAVIEAFVTQVSNLSGNNSIQVLDVAETPFLVNSVNRNRQVLVFGAGAFAGVCGIIAVLELFSQKVRSVPQCTSDEDEILALIPYAE